MKRLMLFACAVAIVAMHALPVSAQESTPLGAPGCAVAPMPQDRIDALAAEAASTVVPSESSGAVALPGGEPVDAAVTEQLRETLMTINACAWAHDLPRMLALYTDAYIVANVFGAEQVLIVPGTPAPPIEATPAPMPTDQQPLIFEAVRLPDGRVAALVSPNSWGGNRQIVWFIEQDGVWLVDDMRPALDDAAVGVAIPIGAQSVVDLVLADAAIQLGGDPATISVVSIEATEWPDAALGCPAGDGVYAQVVTPGYRIVVSDGNATLEYHTGTNDAFVECAG